MKTKLTLGIGMLALASAFNLQAATYTEDFSDLPGWESDWLGVNSNIQNYYGVGSTLAAPGGGIYASDGTYDGIFNIVFDSVFGSSIDTFSMVVAATPPNPNVYTAFVFTAYDMNNAAIYSSDITYYNTSYPRPMVSFATSNGLSRFTIVGYGYGLPEGNTIFGGVQVSTVPIPAAAWLFGSGLIGLVGLARRKN